MVWVIAVLSLVLWAGPAQSHFQLNTNIRIIHIERLEASIRVSMRLPTPLVYARYIADAKSTNVALDAPFVRSAEENGAAVHYMDPQAVMDRPLELARMVADGYRLVLSGTEIPGRPQALRIHDARKQPRFATLENIAAAFHGPAYPEDGEPRYVGDTVLDLRIDYPVADSSGEIRFSSTLPRGVAGDALIANLFLDYQNGERRITRVSGPLQYPVVLDSSHWRAARTFVVQGIEHIFQGADHVLFVLCLTLGAAALPGLLWRVTGFTLGHTITLIAGFFGFALSGAWFIPAIETAIAASILFAGAAALRRTPDRLTFVITALMGLLHGFGFSFVLGSLLGRDSPFLATSLLSFNLGVEIGQVIIVSVTFGFFLLLARLQATIARRARATVAVAAMAVAAWWVVERTALVVAAL